MNLTSCPEWCLLQSIAVITGGVEGRLAKSRLKRTSYPRQAILMSLREFENNDLAFLEVELRTLLTSITPHVIPAKSAYDDLVAELENVCKELEAAVNPEMIQSKEVPQEGGFARHPEERKIGVYTDLWRMCMTLEDDWTSQVTSQLSLVNGPHQKLFVIRKDEAKSILATVTNCNKMVEQLYVQRITLPSPVATTVASNTPTLPEQTIPVLRALFKEFSRCTLMHELLLCPFQDSGPISTGPPAIDLFLSCSACHGQRHEARFLPSDIRYAVQEVTDLCSELQKWRTGTLLQLIVKHRGLFNISNLLPPRSEALIRSLEDLLPNGIFDRIDTANFKRRDQFSANEKTELAIKLARCFLDFISAGHAAPLWDTQKVFLATRASSRLQHGQLYVCFIPPIDDEQECSTTTADPVFLSFAKLLLEIEEGQKIDLSDCKNDFSKVGRLCEHVLRVQASGRKRYAEAVKSCLMFPPSLSDHDDPRTAVQTVISDMVIGNLEVELHPPIPSRWKRRRSTSSDEPITVPKGSLAQSTTGYVCEDMAISSNLSSFKKARLHLESRVKQKMKVIGAETGLYSLNARLENPFQQASSSHKPELVLDDEQHKTWQWIEKFKYLRGKALHKGHSATVRIAVLDTGYRSDLIHNARNSHKVRTRWKDFVGASALRDQDLPEDVRIGTAGQGMMERDAQSAGPLDEDESLHGTRIVNLLHELLPGVEIYVARITKNVVGLKAAHKDIAAAITYATSEESGWNADIVTMSFGSSVRSKDVENAISNALTLRNRSVLFFAAAGNEGGNASELFPAAFDNVISVRGTHGNSSFIAEYNPDPQIQNEGKPLFGTLAYRVPCGPQGELMSGCSIATPILAATAALFIEFAASWSHRKGWTEKEQILLQCLRTCGGMQELFKAIAGKAAAANNRFYVAPDCLFTVSDSGEEKWFNTIQYVCHQVPIPE